ncbi:Carbamoyltransferase-domain-containing protein, partial [Baffinella frigidus]
VAMATVKRLKAETGEANLCIAGGVGLNSVLNGRLARELGFTETFVPAYPGDDGIAVGCCAWGLHGASEGSKAAWKGPLSPSYSDETVDEAVEAAAGYLPPPLSPLNPRCGVERSGFGVVAWYQGRSEAGPRALGHRSILADPRNASMVTHINVRVKSREPFRPFAPSCLAPHAHEWFEGMAGEGVTGAVSPYMSLTADVIPAKRRDIPAVTHVDGTSRLQTVEESAEPLYFRLISAFFKLTGIPMVLNTSFNTLPKEPITESPSDGIRSFLYAKGAIHTLVRTPPITP